MEGQLLTEDNWSYPVVAKVKGLIGWEPKAKMVWVPHASSGLTDVSYEVPAILYLMPALVCTKGAAAWKASQVRSPDSQV